MKRPSVARTLILAFLLVLAGVGGGVGALVAVSNFDGAARVVTAMAKISASASASASSTTLPATASTSTSSTQASSASNQAADVIAPVGQVGLLVTNSQQPGATFVYLDGQSLQPPSNGVFSLSVPAGTSYLRGTSRALRWTIRKYPPESRHDQMRLV